MYPIDRSTAVQPTSRDGGSTCDCPFRAAMQPIHPIPPTLTAYFEARVDCHAQKCELCREIYPGRTLLLYSSYCRALQGTIAAIGKATREIANSLISACPARRSPVGSKCNQCIPSVPTSMARQNIHTRGYCTVPPSSLRFVSK